METKMKASKQFTIFNIDSAEADFIEDTLEFHSILYETYLINRELDIYSILVFAPEKYIKKLFKGRL